jgi:ubiquinone/menaquinone biosynthesis C-methylase UbiE
VGVDLSPRMINTARLAHADLEFHVGDMRGLQFPDQTWGGIVALYSIIHVSPWELAGVFAEVSPRPQAGRSRPAVVPYRR